MGWDTMNSHSLTISPNLCAQSFIHELIDSFSQHTSTPILSTWSVLLSMVFILPNRNPMSRFNYSVMHPLCHDISLQHRKSAIHLSRHPTYHFMLHLFSSHLFTNSSHPQSCLSSHIVLRIPAFSPYISPYLPLSVSASPHSYLGVGDVQFS